MTLQEIEVFLAVVQTGSISAAAQALYITQPAVSRHIKALEQELGCILLERNRGQRRIELTERGRDFVPAAEKLRQVWKEATEVVRTEYSRTLSVSAVGSLSYYLLPGVFRAFLTDSERSLIFHHYHSSEAYDYVADGQVDVALIAEDKYHPQVETIPLFREPMVLVAGTGAALPERVHPTQLEPGRELRLPWNPEYDLWHSFWFSSGARPRAVLNEMAMLEAFFSWQDRWPDSWVIAPIMVAREIAARTGARLHTLEEGPPDEIIYYLQGRRRKPALTQAFLYCLRGELGEYPEVEFYE